MGPLDVTFVYFLVGVGGGIISVILGWLRAHFTKGEAFDAHKFAWSMVIVVPSAVTFAWLMDLWNSFFFIPILFVGFAGLGINLLVSYVLSIAKNRKG